MANYAALVSPLSISGSRLTDGTANASGVVYFFQPGTNTTVNVYSDAAATTIVTQPVTLGEGGKLPTQYSAGVFTTQPVRVLIQDAEGNTVSDNVFVPASAGNVGVSNAGFTDSTLNDVLTDALTSFGGTDWKYKESGGATARTVKAKFAEIWISVKDFGAVGDGVAIDTTAIQAAVSRVKALGGGVVYFPPGTYIIDQAIALTDGTGVRFVGAGMDASIIRSTNTAANAFTLTTCTNASFEDLQVENTGACTSSAFSLTSVTGVTFARVQVDGDAGTPAGYRYGVNAASCSYLSTYDCQIECNPNDASGRAFLCTATARTVFVGGQWSAAGASNGVEFTGNSSRFTAVGLTFSESVLFAAGLTNIQFTFIGCSMVAPTCSTATDPQIRIYACNLDGTTTNVASGGTFTPSRMSGPQQRCRVTSVGANITVAAPTPPPRSDAYDVYLELMFFNDGGADTTGWTVNAVYHLSAAPSVTVGQITSYRLKWDPGVSVWREISRAVTT